jgi:hypothetical protein
VSDVILPVPFANLSSPLSFLQTSSFKCLP